jgi:hypothetical protein
MKVPTVHPSPIAARAAPGRALGSRCRAIAAAVTAATGIGHGAATAAPHPASSPAGTDSDPQEGLQADVGYQFPASLNGILERLVAIAP